jgi:hypothetical protein
MLHYNILSSPKLRKRKGSLERPSFQFKLKLAFIPERKQYNGERHKQ